MEGVPPNRRPVNLVFQSYALFPHLTVFQNIAFGLEMKRVPSVEVAARVEQALEMVRLRATRDRVPSQLSGGEQQRVALARALVNRPAVVLLDEPLGALDQQLRQEMQVELKAIQREVGLTFVCVTHHQEEALTMSDRLAILRQGTVQQVGSPEEIYEAPQNLFVANFIGVSNELAGRVSEAEGHRSTLVVDGLQEKIVVRQPRDAVSGQRVRVVLRPERLSLSSDRVDQGFDNILPAHIDQALYNGSDMHYVVRLANGLVWKARVPNSEVVHKRFVPGETVFVRWNVGEGVVLNE